MHYKKTIGDGFKTFSGNLKNNKTGNIILMYGPEQYLIKWAVESLKKKYVNEAAETMDYLKIDGDSASTHFIIEAAETFSMFSEKRVVWVSDFKPLATDSAKGYSKESLKSLAEYCTNSNKGTILIFSNEEMKETTIVSASLKKNAQIYNFGSITRGELISFAGKRFRAANIEISKRMLSMMVDETGYTNKESDYRLFNFENDIQKIIAHSDGKSITENDIRVSIDGDLETFVFDMLDCISGNQKDRAFLILNNMLNSGKEAMPIIGAIVSQFEMMLSVKQMREDGNDIKAIQRKLGGSEYRIKKVIPHVNKYSVSRLASILSDIYEVDKRIKTGLLNPQTALELFIAGI